MATHQFKRGDKVYDILGIPAVVKDRNAYGYYDITYGGGRGAGGHTDATLTARGGTAPVDDEVKPVVQVYIVTRAHNLDYISATAYLTMADSPHEAIINCMESDGSLDVFLADDSEAEREDQPGYAAELARLRSLSEYELEQDDRDNGNVWGAEVFHLPDLQPGDVVQIARLDTD